MLAPALLLLAGLADPEAAAPPQPVEHLHKVVVDAIRNCPKGKPGEVVVCARDRGIAEGYRLPRLDPRFAQAGGRRGSGVAGLADVGRSGPGSCSAAGGGDFTGCAKADYDAWGDWKRSERTQSREFPW